MKDYLTSNDDEFSMICKNLCESVMNLQVVSAEKKKWGCQFSAVDKKFENMLGVRKQIVMVRFYREPKPVEEPEIHDMQDVMKQQGAMKAFLMSSSGFNNMAKRYAEGRPMELVEKQKLEQLLTKAGSQEK